MKLFYIISTLAVLAHAIDNESQEIADSEAVATMELLKESKETLEPAASAYNYAQSGANAWSQRNYVSQNTITPSSDSSKNYAESKYYPPQNSYVPPQNSYVPPQNSYVPPQNNYVPPQNNYVPPQNNYVPPQNNYVPPQNNYVPPQNNYVPPQNNYVPPQSDYVPQQTYYPTNTWAPPPANYPTTTTPNSVIKNELVYGDNGSYKYEYQYLDGTHVGEEGYYTDPKGTDESLVKKGWYSYPGADGKIYTVSWWADHTGFHATGDHLPTPPPVPAAIQAALDQQAKDEAAKAEAEKNKPQTYPNNPTYYPNQPTYYPNQPTYYPNQPTYYPNQPLYTKPTNSYGK